MINDDIKCSFGGASALEDDRAARRMTVDEHGISRRLSDDIWSNATSRCLDSLHHQVIKTTMVANMVLKSAMYCLTGGRVKKVWAVRDVSLLRRRTSFAGSHAVASDDDRDLGEVTGDALWDDEQASKVRLTIALRIYHSVLGINVR